MSQVLVAGATGALGRHIVAELRRRGHGVRVLSRSLERARGLGIRDEDIVVADALTEPEQLARAVQGTDRVVSTLGAPVSPGLSSRAGFTHVDVRANLALLAAARAARVPRFVYVSTHGGPDLDDVRYVTAHRRVEAALAAARGSLSSTSVRPTGYFSALAAFLDMAKKGPLPLLGGKDARSNPIHDEDLARVVVEQLDEGPLVVEAGGPDVLTRADMGALAFRALGKEPRFRVVPGGIVRFLARVIRPVHPRLGELLEFIERLHRVDAVAEVRGTRSLEAFFRERAAATETRDEVPTLSAAPR